MEKVIYAKHDSAGYGHKKITVELEYNNCKKVFSATINNMVDFDIAQDLESQEKYDAFYNLISNQIKDQVQEWIDSI